MTPRGRRWFLFVGLAVFVLVVGSGVSVVVEHVLPRKPFSASATVAAGSLLRVEGQATDIILRSGTDGSVHVTATGDYAYTVAPDTLTAATADSVTTVTGGCRNACSLRLTVTLPAALEVQARTASGRITATGLTGPLTARTLSGSLEVTGAANPVELHTASGRIAVHDSRAARLTATTGSGEIRASFAAAPTTVSATTTAGRVDLTLPKADYYIDATSRSGTPVIDVPSNRYAANTITIRTESGGIGIH
ncbi:DUF4097 family beta strand repeat protein [Nocardia terpenica]|uniref:DUF4097 family beta strand repeat-containing protein n=1 Tax=Nocardia terpenica TaxID=455432 RepID=UPI00189361D1|nr:DUF4097 family beta strand repeat-containing protein [Nocardia terpenica]MBF6065948.1 DUF4097 family beta strand repeat protein [Nocardia terpenica]MBF6108856.1 DUF4097 family beta strand repeat protein [Nocardia terpenica]MBF6116192.1 DUF4097 family beta strand repeat protein [Nocardia terpenica]MBF6123193.1 DUF4097 family beta strand repeat protein [Nocardia terpenica]MBF6153125.1 DUF4097 family beta strand repeat protein [Nocardia terpenica]